MNSSSNDEVIYLVLKCEHEDLWTLHIHSNCTNGGEYKERSISKEPQSFQSLKLVIIIVPVLSLENFHFFKTISLRVFSGTTICDNQNSLQMGLQCSEIQAQCTSGFGT